MCNLGLWMLDVGQSCLCQAWTVKLPNFQGGKLLMTTQHERAPILDAIEVNDPKSFQPYRSYGMLHGVHESSVHNSRHDFFQLDYLKMLHTSNYPTDHWKKVCRSRSQADMHGLNHMGKTT